MGHGMKLSIVLDAEYLFVWSSALYIADQDPAGSILQI